MTARRAAAVGAGWFVVWWWVTVQAPGWSLSWVAAGVVVSLVASAFTYGGGLVWLPVGFAAGSAAVVTGGWVAVSRLVDAPAGWLHRAVASEAVVWLLCGVVWWFARRRDAAPSPARGGRGGPPLRAALAASGVKALDEPDDGDADPVKVGKPRRVGLGDMYRVTLPPGTTAADLVSRSERVAGALGRPATDVAIEVGDYASEAVVWVGDKGASARQAGPWPALAGAVATRSALDPIDIGLDRYGQPVTVQLHGGSGMLIGSVPGQGKSSLMNLIIAAVLEDPRVRASFVDFKGGADFVPWRDAAVGFHAGAPDDPEVLRVLRAFKADMEAKTARLPSYSATKIGEEIASEPGMGPSILIVDEAHELLGKNGGVSPADRDEAVGIVKAIIARGRAVNSWVLVASQRVTDDEIPAAITQRITVRVAFRLGTQPASEAVLGPDTWRQGWKATQCPAPGVGLIASDAGVKWLRAWHVADADAYRIAGVVTARAQDREPFTGPVTPVLSDDDHAALAQIESGSAPEDWGADVWRRDVRNRRELVAQQRALEAAEAAELDARRAAATGAHERSERVDVEVVAERLAEVWPAGQRGPLRTVWLSVLAAESGVDEAWLVDVLEGAGAPVERVRMRTADGAQPWAPGLAWGAFDGWRAGLVGP